MAKTPKKPTAKTKVKSPAKKLSKAEQNTLLKDGQTGFYQDNKERIDDAIGKCLKHFKDNEPEIVRVVARMLFKSYITHRMKISSGHL